MKFNECKICGNSRRNILYKVKERQINDGQLFDYMYCHKCGTLQLVTSIKPNEMEKYYANTYYAFFSKKKKVGLAWCFLSKLAPFFSKCNWIPDRGLYYLRKYLPTICKLYKTNVEKNSFILDVGSGDGNWGSKLADLGYKNITCLDLYCESSKYSNIKFIHGSLFEIDGLEKYDLITFHHSFEHMDNPREVLSKVSSLLKKTGICLIRIPVCNSAAWNLYKENWYQIDAPRHYFLYTEYSIRLLCEECGLRLEYVVYDSLPSQFVISEQYKKTNLSLEEICSQNLKRQLRKNKYNTIHVNKKKKGDQAAFYIVKDISKQY